MESGGGGRLGRALEALARRPRRLADGLERVHPAWIALALVLVAAGFRLAIALRESHTLVEGSFIKGMPFSDALSWYDMASDFSKNARWSPSWQFWGARRPLYYIFLGAIFAWTQPSVLVAQVVNVVLGALEAAVIFDIVQRLTTRPIAVLAALSHALSPYDARMDLSVMTEPLGAFLSDVALWAFVVGASLTCGPEPRRGRLAFLGSGLALGLSNLARPLTLPALVGLPLAFAFLARRAVSWRRLALATAIFVAGCLLAILPWVLRQHTTYGIWTISDNTAEALYGATDPRYGEWMPAVGDLAGDRSLPERVEFYSRGTRENLRQHFSWYVGHAFRHVLYVVHSTTPLAWVPPLLVLGLVAPLYVVLARRPVALLLGMYVPVTLAIGAMALGADHRFAYPLIWQRTAWALELALSGFVWFQTGAQPPAVWPRPAGWGRFGRVVAMAGALGALLLTVGLVRALTARPGPQPSPILDAGPWIDRALEKESAFRPYALAARRGRVRTGFLAHFDAHEPNNHWSPLFAPRPYEFTAFGLDPGGPEFCEILPGRLPEHAAEDELLLLGIDFTPPGWQRVFLVVALGEIAPGETAPRTFSSPQGETARVYAAEIAALLSASGSK